MKPPPAGIDELDPSDPYARPQQTFPRLSLEMASRIKAYGEIETIRAGQSVFEPWQRGVDFFVVAEGAIEVYDPDPHGGPRVFTTATERQFTGELDLFNDRETLVGARAKVDSRVLRIKRADFRRLVSAEADLGEIILRAFVLRRVGLIQHASGGVILIGAGHAADTLRLERFLVRNNFPHRLLDITVDPDAKSALDCFKLAESDLPVVIVHGDAVLRNPANVELADRIGITEAEDPHAVYDVAVVGAGPAGLAAAVYAASEGLKTIVIEAMAPGGQAGTSSRIENYLGFPTGISGQALAGRAQVQAQKFGARLAISRAAASFDCDGHPFRVRLEDDRSVAARAVVIATGARYRKLDIDNFSRFEGQGIHYAATAMEAKLCRNEEVVVVGGGNSAGQAAVYLAQHAAHVHLVIRGPNLSATMSNYLIQRIELSAKITLHRRTDVTGLEGDHYLQKVTWTDRGTGKSETRPIANVFVMIGAEPNTAWLGGCLDLDVHGFIVTGQAGDGTPLSSPYATSKAGVYAVGDVRSGSVKRVASSVGEGSIVVQAIHAFLAEIGSA